MKTKIALLFIFISVLVIDISCIRNNRGGCGNARYDVIGIDTILILEKNNKRQYSALSNDSIAFDSVVYAITFNQKKIAIAPTFSFINSAYAAPCPEPSADWDIDSIKIYCVTNTDKTDITTHFSIADDYYSSILKIDNSDPDFIKQLNSRIGYFSRFYFNLHTALTQTGALKFTFQFYDKKGRMYEKMSEPVVLLP